jgi:hypothetical protein
MKKSYGPDPTKNHAKSCGHSKGSGQSQNPGGGDKCHGSSYSTGSHTYTPEKFHGSGTENKAPRSK